MFAYGKRRAARIVFLLLAPVTVIGLACSTDHNGPLPEPSEDIPLQALAGMNLRESHAGRTRWILKADSAFNFGEDRETLLRGVSVEFYNESGDSVLSWLTALRGSIDPRTRNLVARDSVVVHTAEGHTLETEELRWEQEIEKIVSDKFVRLTQGDNVITGVGIESDAGLNHYVIRSQVEAEFHENEDAQHELDR